MHQNRRPFIIKKCDNFLLYIKYIREEKTLHRHYLSYKLAKQTLLMEQPNLKWFNAGGTRITFLKHFAETILVREGS